MKIVIDTTVLANGFHASTANVRLLENFLGRTGNELCVPAVVIEEAVNLVRKAIKEANPKLADVRRLTGRDDVYKKLDTDEGVGAYRLSLLDLIAKLKGRILDYPVVKHQELCARALREAKPFAPNGRGYKDALIWFNVLDLAKSCNQEVIFISNNSSDFCEGPSAGNLHLNLLNDLKNNDLTTSSVRLILSLDDFIKQFEIETLPVSPLNTAAPDQLFSYQTLLIEHRASLVEKLTEELPEFLRRLSDVNAKVEDLEVLDLDLPKEIGFRDARALDTDTRVLLFSATYNVALAFLARRSDIGVWSERLSLHLRQDWDETRVRIQGTASLSVLFRLIERKKLVQDFSIGIYKEQFRGKGPVAIKQNQVHIHAGTNVTDWGSVSCSGCSDGFSVGGEPFHEPLLESESISILSAFLSEDHANNRLHNNAYDLFASPATVRAEKLKDRH